MARSASFYSYLCWFSLSCFVGGNAAAQAPASNEPILIKFATVGPEGTPWFKQVEHFKSAVQKDSNGRFKVKAFLGLAMGGEKSIVRRCVQGSLDMCGITVGALASIINDLSVLEAPYLFKDYAEVDRILDGPALPIIKEILDSKGLVFYSWSENGWRSFGTKTRQIKEPKDLSGLKIRAQEHRLYIDTLKALGAIPVPMPLPEVVTSLQTGVVDGYDQSPLYLLAASWHSQTKFFSLTEHIFQPGLVVFNKKFINKLPKDLQKVLLQSGPANTTYGRNLIRKINEPLLEAIKGAGIQIYKPTPAQRAAFILQTRKVHLAIRKGLSPKGKKLLNVIYKAQDKK